MLEMTFRKKASRKKTCAMIQLLFLLLFLLSGCKEVTPDINDTDDPPVGAETNILFLGNSYTYYHNLPGLFEQLTIHAGKDVYVDQRVAGGRQVPFFVSDTITHQKLAEVEWDYVVFQASHIITEYEDKFWQHIDKAIEMDSLIRLNSATAKTVLYMEQAMEGGDKTYDPNDTFLEMSNRIAKGTKIYADLMGTKPVISPVAVAWAEVVKADNTEVELLEPDGEHPTLYGAYVSACVFYTTFFRERIDTDYYAGLDSTFAKHAQRIANEVVLDSLSEWNNSY